MPRFRYQANTRFGAPVFGSQDAEDEAELRRQLAERGLHLRHATVLSLDPSISFAGLQLPRLVQLRLGAHLREALLTDLPAHEAVRAMAAEPFRHPLLSLMPWLFGMTAFLTILAVSWTILQQSPGPMLSGLLVVQFLIIPVVWIVLWHLLDTRPRQILWKVADRLESGDSELSDLLPLLPGELREVMRSQSAPTCRARAVAELVPAMMGSRLYIHRFALSYLGPLVISAVVFLGLYAIAIFLIPGFEKVFSDFGVELPGVTIAVLGMSRALQQGGTVAFWSVSTIAGLGLLAIYMLSVNQRAAQIMSSVPVVGLPFRWMMQARVARILGAMIRHGSPRSEAIRAATAASGFEAVKSEGALIAERIATGDRHGAFSVHLSALPIALLAQDDAGDDDFSRKRSAGIAQSLSSFANMLEHASVGHGRLLGLVLQAAVILFGGFMVGMIVIALFLPLLKLINDLA